MASGKGFSAGPQPKAPKTAPSMAELSRKVQLKPVPKPDRTARSPKSITPVGYKGQQGASPDGDTNLNGLSPAYRNNGSPRIGTKSGKVKPGMKGKITKGVSTMDTPSIKNRPFPTY